MKDKIDLVKELLASGQISKDWVIKNILNDIAKDSRKDKIKRIFF